MKHSSTRLDTLLTAVLAFITWQAAGQTLLYDDFNGSTINPSLWQASTPFSDSSITENGGSAVFQNRGRLLTTASFPAALDITGRFEFAGSIHDVFRIVTRTDGITSNPWAEFDHGIGFSFSIENDSNQTAGNVFIVTHGWPGVSTELARGTFPMALNTFYDFRITDDGNNVALYVNDLVNPLLTASDSSVYGNAIGLSNREGGGGGSWISDGSVTELDWINVSEIPEPSGALLMVSGLGLLLVRRSVKFHALSFPLSPRVGKKPMRLIACSRSVLLVALVALAVVGCDKPKTKASAQQTPPPAPEATPIVVKGLYIGMSAQELPQVVRDKLGPRWHLYPSKEQPYFVEILSKDLNCLLDKPDYAINVWLDTSKHATAIGIGQNCSRLLFNAGDLSAEAFMKTFSQAYNIPKMTWTLNENQVWCWEYVAPDNVMVRIGEHREVFLGMKRGGAEVKQHFN